MTTALAAAGPTPLVVSIQLPLSPRVPLVKLDTVIAARGENGHIIEKYVEQGRLRWVFNVAVKRHGMRDPRYWSREVSAFAGGDRNELAALHAADIRSVLQEILGDRDEFLPGDVCLLLGISRATLMRLRDELLAPGGQSFPRAGLERFLKRRLLD